MTTVTLRKEDKKTLGVQDEALEIQDSLDEDDTFNSLQSLYAEEKNLTEQKTNLKALLHQLEFKAKEEIEKKKRKIEDLNSEVSDLKRKCKKFANCVNSDPASGRSKADP